MFLLITTLLYLFLFGYNALDVTLDNWHKELYEMDKTVFGTEINMSQFINRGWNSLKEDEQNQIIFSLMKPLWSNYKKDNVYPPSQNTTCDLIMTGKLWKEMDLLERRYVSDCIMKRIAILHIKTITHVFHWLPESYLYDDNVRESVNHDIGKCLFIERQYYEDQKVDFARFSSQEMIRMWSFFGLNTSHYYDERIVDDQSLRLFQKEITLKDYILWNNLHDRCSTYTSLLAAFEVSKGIDVDRFLLIMLNFIKVKDLPLFEDLFDTSGGAVIGYPIRRNK